jgi:hypothetical protein
MTLRRSKRGNQGIVSSDEVIKELDKMFQTLVGVEEVELFKIF